MTGSQLRRMRERAGVSRYYVARYLDMSQVEISHLELGRVEADSQIVDGYRAALDYVRLNSLPARGRKFIWWAPSSTEKSETL